MRRLLLLPAALCAALVLYLAAGGGLGSVLASAGGDGVIVIGDKRFSTQLDDMAVNGKSYAGRTVRLEGFTAPLKAGLPWRFAVVRIYYCCGADGYPVGLPCEYRGDAPGKDAWIEVEGTFRLDGKNAPYLEVTKLTVKDTPGSRVVYS